MAEERNNGPDARYRVRINFSNMLRLAHADRPVERAYAAGSVPPEMRQLWNRLESQGVEVHLFNRGTAGSPEQEMPDRVLQLRMLEDGWDYNGTPGIVSLLTGDGAGYVEGPDFTGPWSECTIVAGEWKSCRGPIPAIRECASGRWRTAPLSLLTTFMIPLLPWSRPDLARNWPSRGILPHWICRVVRWRSSSLVAPPLPQPANGI